MEKQNRKKLVYSLCIEDIQNVAYQEIERGLTIEEINKIKDSIATNVKWYDVIADAIHQNIKTEEFH